MLTERNHRLRRGLEWLLDRPWMFIIALIAAGFTAWAVGTRSQPYHVNVEFPSAFNLVSGLPVDVNGLQVGMISSVKYVNNGAGGSADVQIGISDSDFRPLHAGTTVESRWGSTIGNGTRRLDLIPGPSSAPAIPDGGVIQQKDTTAAVDLDQVLNVLKPARRARLTNLVSNMDTSLTGEAPAIGQALHNSAPAFSATNNVLNDLTADTYALRGLILNGDRLTGELARQAPAVQSLVSGAGQIFTSLAQHATGIRNSISAMPAALTSARTTLGRLDTSVDTLNTLVTDIRPGAKALPGLATALDPTLAKLRNLVPTGVATLKQATQAAPHVSTLLTDATPLMSQINSATSQLAPMVACIRPYAPEAGDAVESASEWMQTYVKQPANGTPGVKLNGQVDPGNPADIDEGGVRAMPEVSLATIHSWVGVSTKTFTQLAGKGYALPRPPGESVGQPWYLPECGAGPNSTNPADDPENPVK